MTCAMCEAAANDPATPEVCPSCGKPRDAQMLTSMQLGLFGEAVPLAQAQKLRSSARGGITDALDYGGSYQSVVRSHQDALAVITALFHVDRNVEPDYIDRTRELLAGLSNADMREAVMGAAWFAARALRYIEEADPYMGEDLLQEFGITLAEYSDREPP